ncbi:MAG: hypothetical protein LUD80_01475, partial [Clostridiales bacterium]|nr:hypothetical protein [Clostridiales bacterium]
MPSATQMRLSTRLKLTPYDADQSIYDRIQDKNAVEIAVGQVYDGKVQAENQNTCYDMGQLSQIHMNQQRHQESTDQIDVYDPDISDGRVLQQVC